MPSTLPCIPYSNADVRLAPHVGHSFASRLSPKASLHSAYREHRAGEPFLQRLHKGAQFNDLDTLHKFSGLKTFFRARFSAKADTMKSEIDLETGSMA